MVHRTLQDGGQFSAIRDAPFRIAARLRFPVTGQWRHGGRARSAARV